MRFATAQEKMQMMTGVTSENISDVKEKIIFDRTDTGMQPVLTEDGTPQMRLDMREYLRRRMKEEGISYYKMAQYVGKYDGNFNNFLNGKTTIPLETIERILWVLDGKAWGEDEDNTRIIKQ